MRSETQIRTGTQMATGAQNLRSRIITFAVAGLIAVAIFGGYQYIQHQKAVEARDASLVYESLLSAIKRKDVSMMHTEANRLMDTYKRTPYAGLAALMMARVSVGQQDYPAATDYLKRILDGKQRGPLAHVARVRLSRVLAAQSQYEEALKLLENVKQEGYTSLYEEAKGDIYMMQNEREKAKIAYQNAKQAIPSGMSSPTIQLKESDLIQED